MNATFLRIFEVKFFTSEIPLYMPYTKKISRLRRSKKGIEFLKENHEATAKFPKNFRLRRYNTEGMLYHYIFNVPTLQRRLPPSILYHTYTQSHLNKTIHLVFLCRFLRNYCTIPSPAIGLAPLSIVKCQFLHQHRRRKFVRCLWNVKEIRSEDGEISQKFRLRRCCFQKSFINQ